MPKKPAKVSSASKKKTGSCGHSKGSWDNHHKCIVCAKCTRNNPCEMCCSWPPATWNLAEYLNNFTVRKEKKDTAERCPSSFSSVSGKGVRLR